MIEVETQTTEVEVINNVEVTSTSQVEVETVDLSDLDITIAKKEYVITGDDIYIPMLYDDAPQWMKDLVQLVVDVSISSGNQSLINDLSTMLQDFAVSYVPLNQYTQTILDLGDEDTRLNGLIETLNSNFNDGLSTANAQITSLQLTKASKDEVVAQVIQTIAAQLADGTSNIGSTIGRIDQAIADETSARATSFQVLTSSLEDTNLDVTANANATHVLNTYVGLNNVTGTPNGTGLLADVSAIASDVTTLSTNLQSGAGTWASADSALTNSLNTSIINGDAVVESKFAYNSVVGINGVYKKSGFGLTTNYISGAGTQANPYVSEFWIDASRLKFTNSNQTGQVAPFTIDASGVTPQITFNGRVSFGSIYDQTIIQYGYINTGLIQVNAINASQINTVGLIAENISSSIISGKTINGGVINGARINGAVIKASYLDLNGELEVLTNFVIPAATYNANPSLYSDSVLIAADNTYRIPTSSTIYEQAIPSSMPNNGDVLYGVIRSYNCANAGHNVKAVKVRPTITVSSPVTVMDMRQSASYNCNGSFYLGDILLINLRIISIVSNTLVYSVTTIDNGTINYTINDSNPNSGTYVFSQSRTVVSSGVSFTISVGASNNQYGYSASATIQLNQGNHTLTRDFNYTGNGFKLMRLYNNNGGGGDDCNTALGTNIYINNLL